MIFGMFVMFACQAMQCSHLHLLSSVASTKPACQLWTGTKRSTTSSRPFLQRPTGTSGMSLKGFRRCVIRLLSGRASNSITSGISFYWKFLNSLESCLFHWFSTLFFMLYIPQMLRRALHSYVSFLHFLLKCLYFPLMLQQAGLSVIHSWKASLICCGQILTAPVPSGIWDSNSRFAAENQGVLNPRLQCFRDILMQINFTVSKIFFKVSLCNGITWWLELHGLQVTGNSRRTLKHWNSDILYRNIKGTI